jgi:hypothetical protein
MKRWSAVLALVVGGLACDTPTPAAPVPGSFSVRVAPNPVVFRQLYPGAATLALASPPPPDPRYYTASMTLVISEGQGGTGHLDAVETQLVSADGVPTVVSMYDGSCDFGNELTRGGNRAVPPHGSLEWCLGRLATPDAGREYTLRFTARITDGFGTVSTPTGDVRVVVQR